MLTSKKITAYSKIVAGLPDVPSPAMSPLELKQWFDTAPEEMRVAFNALIDNLLSTATGDSGAESIGIEPIVGVSAANVQNALEQLKLLINDAVSGAIPNGTLGPEKLNFDVATQAELDTHIADTVKHVPYALATGTENTYAVTLTPSPTSYTRGMAVSVEINALNTGASTININGLGAKTIKNSNGNDVGAGKLKVGIIYTLRYNGTNFILQGEGGSGNATAADLLANKTASTDTGDITGTMPQQTGDGNGFINRSSVAVGSAGRITATLPDGFYSGMTAYLDDPDFIAGNIADIANILGLQGTMQRGFPLGNDNLVVAGAAASNVPSSAYTKVKVITAKALSTHRVQFSLRSNAVAAAFGRIYKNGVPFGTERTVSGTTYVNFVEDLVFNANDTIELWLKGSGANSAQSTFLALLALLPTITMDT